MPSSSDSGKFAIEASAVDLTWSSDDRNVWFVTAEGSLGYFEPRSPWSSTVFPQVPVPAGRADCILAWPGHGVWTFVTGQSDSAFVRCDSDGIYQTHTLSGRTQVRSLAFAQDERGRTQIVAPLADWNSLAFFDLSGGISQSQGHSTNLYGIAVAEQDPTLCWLSSPEGRSLVSYDMATGRFSTPVNVGAEPGDLAITPAGDVVWVATTDNRIYKYTVQDKRFSRIDIPAPAHRLLAAADGTLWFASVAGDAIGYVLPGADTAVTIPTGARSRPSGLAVSGDSRLWAALSGEKALRGVSRYSLAVESGDRQTAVVGSRFTEPLAVKALQLDGSAVGRQRIKFTVEGGSAVFENGRPTETRTTGNAGDKLGVATSSLLKAVKEGTCVVTAVWTETDAVASFTRLDITPEPGAADRVRYVSGAGQSVPAGKSFDSPLTVIVEDVEGNPLEGVETIFEILGEHMATFPGEVDTAKVPSAADGSAASPVLTAGETAGTFSVKVRVADTSVSLLLELTVN
ncbi:hypothetical protein OHS33_31275 [Streptomyces sp. NBC_00536]|uniref:Vgb family protein n=1 Tax=Streptomyces sp. NBC_00536 TaxID=2975769 RepID=UPI002E81767A|nr:hypothetical protein [Streptomyces sp. NBC_00536]WUC82443.1 hypothetical protein OHS33_31275 [Streptomyces sp. NBC_00536]